MIWLSTKDVRYYGRTIFKKGSGEEQFFEKGGGEEEKCVYVWFVPKMALRPQDFFRCKKS